MSPEPRERIAERTGSEHAAKGLKTVDIQKNNLQLIKVFRSIVKSYPLTNLDSSYLKVHRNSDSEVAVATALEEAVKMYW